MKNITSYLKTMILFAGLTGLIMAFSYAIGGRAALAIGLFIALVMNFVAYWFSDKMVLAGTGAKPLTREQSPHVYEDVEELTKKMKLPMPRLYFVEDIQPNAFATGRNPSNGVVAVTRGLVEHLDRNEVRGVLAHELGHIKNHDILISTIAAVFAGAITSIADIFMWGSIFGGGKDEEAGNPFNAVGGIVMIIIAPIAAMLLQFAISRTREFEADATAAQFTGHPQDLANALVKIERIAQNHPMAVNPAYASLFIQNPFHAQGLMELFSTHPSTEKRIARLMRMK